LNVTEAIYFGGYSPFNQPVATGGFQRVGSVAIKALEGTLSLATGRQHQD
jgi:hypothetical protein